MVGNLAAAAALGEGPVYVLYSQPVCFVSSLSTVQFRMYSIREMIYNYGL